MAIEIPDTARGKTLILDGLAQADINMQNHKLINLDTSNLPPGSIPPSINPPANQWLHSWDHLAQTWTATRPRFVDIAGIMTTGSGGQQRSITELGTIAVGVWNGTVIAPLYLPTLSGMRIPVADVNLNQHRLINVADPVNAQDAVNKRFMDFLLQGLNPKLAVAAASTSDVALVGVHDVDGVHLVMGNRVLVKNQNPGRENLNGIYRVATSPDGHWERADDCNTPDEMERAYCVVRGGTVNANTSWVQVKDIANINTDPKEFVLFSTAIGAPGPQGEPGQGVPVGGLTAQVLSKIDGTDYNTHWVNPQAQTILPSAIVQQGPFVPAGTLRTDILIMMGFGSPGRDCIIRLNSGTSFLLTISGTMYNNNSAGGILAEMHYGTGTPPLNGSSPPSGRSFPIGGIAGLFGLQANKFVPFSLSAIVSGLTVGVPYWLDLAIVSVTTGKAFVSEVSITAHEIK